ncbi:glutamine--fructose-6-phosphate transaminase (isomerizing) (plasmid) [Cereibacter azotoformans]|uniref:glutamine--fructose-6-phosphate transaminase (isomerizing) n=1 Tax=Cereibacter azotoformans TaxID=43057 RepID=UPI001EE9DBA9|nr:glutamine--fructose-6-phosphate transaminase (isomerizing) [Cereibacter azotoformans]ULB12102.1 glutamine--fructose-6-phosphate transaminase (isomerizing) [Cereibacter azotoformans]
MCGIVGILGQRPAAPVILDSLRRLEYRGYDSAGIVALDGGVMDRRRSSGKLSALAELLEAQPLAGTSGLGHTRWATHGKPVEANAHPHRAGPVAVVHNGIIENYLDLRRQLEAEGWSFGSETDSEVIATLCAAFLRRGLAPEDAAAATLARLRGAYALCLMFDGADDLMICARRGSPLVIGHGEGEMFVGSDALALAPLTRRLTYLEEGDWAVLTRRSMVIHDAEGRRANRPLHHLEAGDVLAEKGPYPHFMLKEIHEQPGVAARVLGSWTARGDGTVTCDAAGMDWARVPRLTIAACGTACLAGQVGKIWLERIARLPVEIEIASEFRYREPPLPEGGVTLVISQSGETADTLAALRYAKEAGQRTLGLVNVPTSTIAREVDVALATHAGPEIGVASTKAFTAQLLCLLSFTIMVARQRGTLDEADERRWIGALSSVPRLIAETLAAEPEIAAAAAALAEASDAIFVGRGLMHPLALEGALKLKEITYIHAEGYAAGELKHGPIALVDATVPVVALAPSNGLFDKLDSNIREVMARDGRVLLLTDAAGAARLGEAAWRTIVLPDCEPFLQPFVQAVAIQLLAYHCALARGTDIDQPRNLAKSVTVE